MLRSSKEEVSRELVEYGFWTPFSRETEGWEVDGRGFELDDGSTSGDSGLGLAMLTSVFF
jgi:hypothetical protein